MFRGLIWNFRKHTNHRFQVGVVDRKLYVLMSSSRNNIVAVYDRKKTPRTPVVKFFIDMYIHADMVFDGSNCFLVCYTGISCDLSP